MIENIFIGAKARKDYELVVHWMVDNGTIRTICIDLSSFERYVLKSGWVTAYTYGMEFISKRGVKI